MVSMWFQTVIQWYVIGSGLVDADWGKRPLNSWEMAVVSATLSTGSVIYNTVRGLHAWSSCCKDDQNDQNAEDAQNDQNAEDAPVELNGP